MSPHATDALWLGFYFCFLLLFVAAAAAVATWVVKRVWYGRKK
ncbi:MAG TPA: hypothetical protein VKB87_07705 [Myxococcaceae bacterium]|nr:hypothetical protein [Myxococcaceae bacterium]